jgi:hypothetical protein
MQIQISSNHGPRGSEGATIRKTNYSHVYIENNLLQNQQANFYETWYKSSLGEKNERLLKRRARFFFKRR